MSGFPSGFQWGVSTSAYQVEGAAHESGKGASIWDVFSHRAGRIADGTTGDVATDHLRRMDEDLDLLAELGVGVYRFSTAWTRLQPDGRGRLRSAGSDVYDRLVDGLLERGIEPWPCLYHWDLPQALQERGGWASRDTADHFAEYAAAVAERLGDRVRTFLLLNEPNVHALLGHLLGIHAPGESDVATYAAALHHQNLATGLALARLRDLNGGWTLGTVLNLQPVVAGADGEEHAQAARLFDAVWNRACLDPLLRGSYPDAAAPFLDPVQRAGDLALIAQPIDLLGVNFYTRMRVRASASSLVGMEMAPAPPDAELTAMGWEVAPEALTAQLLELKEAYGNPAVVVAENGAAYEDPPARNGRVDDPRRCSYLVRHVSAVAEAIDAGCDVRGYLAWTLVDNFEWSEGFGRRFGLVHLDLDTLRRTPKASFELYRDVIRERRVPANYE